MSQPPTTTPTAGGVDVIAVLASLQDQIDSLTKALNDQRVTLEALRHAVNGGGA